MTKTETVFHLSCDICGRLVKDFAVVTMGETIVTRVTLKTAGVAKQAPGQPCALELEESCWTLGELCQHCAHEMALTVMRLKAEGELKAKEEALEAAR